MFIRTGPHTLMAYLCTALFLGDVKAKQPLMKSVSMLESCGEKIEVGLYKGYRLNILGEKMSDLRTECEVKFYGRRGAYLFYLMRNVDINTEQVSVYIQTKSSQKNHTTREVLDYRWRDDKGKKSGGTSTIITLKRSFGQSRDFSVTMEIFGKEYTENVDPDVNEKRLNLGVSIFVGLVVVCTVCPVTVLIGYTVIHSLCCKRNRRPEAPETQRMARRNRNCETQAPAATNTTNSNNVSSPTASSRQYVPTLPPIQRNPYTGSIEEIPAEGDEYLALTGDTSSIPRDTQSNQPGLSERRNSNTRPDVDPPPYHTIVPRTSQLAVTVPDDGLPTYDEAAQLESSTLI